jgi:hypothetical protein
MYQYTFILTKVGFGEYSLTSEKKVHLVTFSNMVTETEAMDNARAWASSFSSAEVVTNHEYKNRS